LHVDSAAGTLRVGDKTFREGDLLSIDGSTGEVLAGGLDPHPSPVIRQVVDGVAADDPRPITAFLKILEWADGAASTQSTRQRRHARGRPRRTRLRRPRGSASAAPSTCSSPTTASPGCDG
jgi:hypothetical protein